MMPSYWLIIRQSEGVVENFERKERKLSGQRLVQITIRAAVLKRNNLLF